MDFDPIIGNWYLHLDKGESFQVVDVDEEAGNVEIQYFDGGLDKVDLDEWYELEIEPMEAPEDWTGPVDDIERDDLEYTETAMGPKEWSEPTREVVPRRTEEKESEEEIDIRGLEEEGEEGTDDWGEKRFPEEKRREEED